MADWSDLHPAGQSLVFNVQVISGYSFLQKGCCFIYSRRTVNDSRIRKDNAPANMNMLRHIALNLLRQERTLKRGVAGKRLKAAMNPNYLLKVLTV